MSAAGAPEPAHDPPVSTALPEGSTSPVRDGDGRTRPRAIWWLWAWIALGAATGVIAVLPGGEDAGPTASQPVTVVGVAVLSYLVAAVAGSRRVGWIAAGAFAVLVVLSEVVGLSRFAVLGVVGALVAVVGLAVSPRRTGPQALAAIGYLGVGCLALLLAPRAGLVVAGVTLAAHVVWDVVHYRRDAVVDRSLALWCIGLDLVVGVVCVVVALTG